MTCLHFLNKNGYVDGLSVNIWHVFIKVYKKRNKNISHVDGSAVNIWKLSNIWYVDGWAINLLLLYLHIFKYKYFETQTCHMLTAHTYVWKFSYVDGWAINMWYVCISLFIKLNKNMSYVDGSPINIWNSWIDRAIW